MQTYGQVARLQTHRQTRDRQIDGHVGMQAGKPAGMPGPRRVQQTSVHAGRQTASRTGGQADRQTGRQADRRQPDRRTCGQADRQVRLQKVYGSFRIRIQNSGSSTLYSIYI
jgi:hypothetical protein